MTRLKILGIITTIAALGGIALSTTETQASGDEGVPEWFKGVAQFWAEGGISTAEFLDSIQFLIGEEIILVPGFGPITEANAEGVDQASLDEIWEAIGELQGQLETMSTGDTLAELSCDPGQIAMYSAVGQWICQDDTTGQTLGSLSCDAGQIPKYTTTGTWKCQDDVTGATQSLKDMGLTTYVKYKTVFAKTSSVNCDAGDVATGGGFGTLGGDYNYMYPLPSHGNPSKAMFDPDGWQASLLNSGPIDVWVVCLDLTPAVKLSSIGSIPSIGLP